MNTRESGMSNNPELNKSLNDEIFNDFLLLYAEFKAEKYTTPGIGDLLGQLNDGRGLQDDAKITRQQLESMIQSKAGYMNEHDFLEEASASLYEKRRLSNLTPEQRRDEERRKGEDIREREISRQKYLSKSKKQSHDDAPIPQIYLTDKGYVTGVALGPSASLEGGTTIQTSKGKLDVNILGPDRPGTK